ncbi:cytochrome P450 [Amylostereum chailletii]|nr:cytochrome P450 [Amylostereum chailletii]
MGLPPADSTRAVIIGSERVVYGYDDSSEHLQFSELVEEAAMVFKMAADPTVGWVVDKFPLLRHLPSWFPGASFQRNAATYRNIARRLIDEPFQESVRKIQSASCAPCLVSSAIDENPGLFKDSEELEAVKNTAASAYVGMHISVSVICSLFLAMVLHPDAQKRAQREIDAVTGRTRFPTIADRKDLPFIDCIIKEVMRWSPPAPFSFPHVQSQGMLSEGGMFIPEGCIIIVNLWAIFRDEIQYPQPNQFIPERYLDADVLDPMSCSFGYGRRLCPGIHIVDSWIWIMFANLLATLDISCPVNPDTNEEIRPKVAFTNERIRYCTFNSLTLY